MNQDTVSSNIYIFLAFNLSLPFVKILVLYGLTKLLKFKIISLKKTSLVVLVNLIAFICFAVLVHYLEKKVEIDYASLVLLLLFIIQTLAIKKLFKETFSKTLYASFLTTLSLMFLLMLYPLVTLLLN
jgi:hypothetical protein